MQSLLVVKLLLVCHLRCADRFHKINLALRISTLDLVKKRLQSRITVLSKLICYQSLLMIRDIVHRGLRLKLDNFNVHIGNSSIVGIIFITIILTKRSGHNQRKTNGWIC